LFIALLYFASLLEDDDVKLDLQLELDACRLLWQRQDYRFDGIIRQRDGRV